MLQLRSCLLPLLRVFSSHSAASASASYYASLHLHRFPLSTAATATPFSIEDYLVGTCGLTGAQALKASKKLSHLKSSTNPDAVLAVLSGVGLSRADLAAVVAADPKLLCSKADNLARRVASLRDRVGLSDPQIGSLLVAGGATAVRRCDVAPRLEFWIPFLGSFEMLLKLVKGSNAVLTSDVEKVIKPNIALLQECGLSVCDIVKMSGRLLTCNQKRIEAFVQSADELGVQRTSGLFKYVVAFSGSEGRATAKMKFLSSTLSCSMEKIRGMVCKAPCILANSEEKLLSKIEFLRSTLDCSVDKIHGMVCKTPNILGLSERNLRRKIEFLITNVGLEPDYILSTPVLLTLSLEKRLVPRHCIVEVLVAKGLIKDVGFWTYAQLGEKDFIARYIDQHKNAVPGLADAYATVRAGKMPPELKS